MNTLKRYQIWIALAVLILPVLARGLWFYQGIPSRPEIQAPDYAGASLPQPPLSTPVPETAAAPSGQVVVVDYSHSNQFDPSEIQALVSFLTGRGARVEFDNGYPYLSTRLKYASAYIVISPGYSFTVEEVTLVGQFIQRGGRLIVFTDPTHGIIDYESFTGNPVMLSDVSAANSLLAPFDIAFENDYLYNLVNNEGNFRNVLFARFSDNDLTKGLSQVAFYGVHSVSAQSGQPFIIGDKNTLSSRTDSSENAATIPGEGLAAAALNAGGNVLAIGDFTFLLPPYNQVADNNLLLGRIADFALGGTRTHALADFPYLFGPQAHLLVVGDLQLTADLLAPLAYLQKVLRMSDTSLSIAPEAVAGSDTVVIGLLTPSEDLDRFIEPFRLGLDDPASVTVPGFGQIGRTGVGLMLFAQHLLGKPGLNGNTLILLTDSPEDLPMLINLLANGDMSSCVIQNNIGVCSIGYSGGSFGTPMPSEEIRPAETPTPAG